MIFGTRQLSGKKVVSQDGCMIGEVLGLDLDTETWAVLALEVKLERDVLEAMSLKRPVFGTHSIKIAVNSVSGVSDTIILRDQVAQIRPADSGAVLVATKEAADKTNATKMGK